MLCRLGWGLYLGKLPGWGSTTQKKSSKSCVGEEGRLWHGQGGIFPRPKAQRRSRSSHDRAVQTPNGQSSPVCCGPPASQPLMAQQARDWALAGASPAPDLGRSPSMIPACECACGISLALRDFHAANKSVQDRRHLHGRASNEGRFCAEGRMPIVNITTAFFSSRLPFPHFGTLAHHGAWVISRAHPGTKLSDAPPDPPSPLGLSRPSPRGSTRRACARGPGRASAFIRCPSLAHSR